MNFKVIFTYIFSLQSRHKKLTADTKDTPFALLNAERGETDGLLRKKKLSLRLT